MKTKQLCKSAREVVSKMLAGEIQYVCQKIEGYTGFEAATNFTWFLWDPKAKRIVRTTTRLTYKVLSDTLLLLQRHEWTQADSLYDTDEFDSVNFAEPTDYFIVSKINPKKIDAKAIEQLRELGVEV